MKTNKHLTTFLSELPENIPLPDIETFADRIVFTWYNVTEHNVISESIEFTVFTTSYNSVIGCLIYRMFNKPWFYEEIDDYVIGKLIGMLNDLFTP